MGAIAWNRYAFGYGTDLTRCNNPASLWEVQTLWQRLPEPFLETRHLQLHIHISYIYISIYVYIYAHTYASLRVMPLKAAKTCKHEFTMTLNTSWCLQLLKQHVVKLSHLFRSAKAN